VPRSAPKGHELGRAFPRGIPGQKGSDNPIGPSPTLRRPETFQVSRASPLMPATFLLSRSVPSSLVTVHLDPYRSARPAAPFVRHFSGATAVSKGKVRLSVSSLTQA